MDNARYIPKSSGSPDLRDERERKHGHKLAAKPGVRTGRLIDLGGSKCMVEDHI
jgi:hypothetical protein